MASERREGEAGLGGRLLGLPGVGPRTAERLAARGLVTRGDLLDFVPRRWDDLRELTPIGALQVGLPQTARGRVLSARILFGRRRSLEVRFGPDGDDEPAGKLVARWFRASPGMKERFAIGARFLVAGVVREYRGERVMAHPETERLADGEVGSDAGGGEGGQGKGAVGVGVRARYPEVEGVPGRLIAELAARVAREHAHQVVDPLPPALVAEHGWPTRGQALALLHAVGEGGEAPDREAIAALNEGRHPAQQRLAWEELLLLQLAVGQRRVAVAREAAPACPVDGAAIERFLAGLPFAPTAAQRRAIGAIAADLARASPMHRLLQGDVGAGKTVVMYAAAELAMAAGHQVAVMAPTEILAEQHARTLGPWAAATGRRLALLTASTAKAARAEILEAAAAGAIDLLVGTHALLGEGVRLPRLALVVVDEQHRFGVAQRAALRGKGGGALPHLLVMTATPIPRTLALTAWGDLEVTTLDELPPGRSPPETRLALGARARRPAYLALGEALADGRQGYVVCPRVAALGDGEGEGLAALHGDGEDPDTGSAEATFRRLARALPGVAVGLVHGRLPAVERDAVMRAFEAGTLQLLVATTVVEVGVDVPAADVMLIEGAERFGLATLHQLRGRIGRAPGVGGRRALCLLCSDAAPGSDAARRLEVVAGTTDGFVLAEADLLLRGPGELFGTLQSGLPSLRFADLRRDLPLLQSARAAALDILASDPALASHGALRAALASATTAPGGG